MKIKDRKVVGIWIRVSTEDQAQGESPIHHEKRARAYAQSRDWIVDQLYDLSGVSGKSVFGHPETKRMLEDVRTGRISGIIFSKLARLARNTRELLDFAELFNEYEADLISLHEAIDTSTPAGRLFYTMIAAMAQWEREEIADRVAASVPIRAQLGKNTGGQASFGYRWTDGVLKPDPKEAPVRKLIYELFLEHRRRKTVARILNEQGYRTRGGAKFSDTTITRLLRDPTAKGEHRANYTYSRGKGKAAALKPKDEWVIQKCDPVVSESIWNECNAILAQQTSKKAPGPKGRYLFAGKVVCHCGTKMYVKTGSAKFVCSSCRTKIPQDDLEAVFRDELKSFFMSDEELVSFLGKVDASIDDMRQLIVVLEKEQKDTEAKANRLYESYQKEELEGREFGNLYRPLLDRIEVIENRIPELEAQIDATKISRLSSEEVITEAKDLYGRWEHLSHDEKRSIIETVTDKIVVGNRDIEISLHYVPIPQKDGQKATERHGFIAATS